MIEIKVKSAHDETQSFCDKLGRIPSVVSYFLEKGAVRFLVNRRSSSFDINDFIDVCDINILMNGRQAISA